jgi:MFS superfamily sulfate permease-like transporter
MLSALIFVSCPRCPAERSTLWHCSVTRGAQDRLDLTSADVLKGLLKELQGKGIAVYVADMHAPVREFAQRTGLIELIGEDHIFPTVDAAVHFLETDAG